MIGTDVIIGATLLKTITIESDHVVAAFADVAYHFGRMFIVWAIGVAAIIVGVVPDITWTIDHTVVVEVNVA